MGRGPIYSNKGVCATVFLDAEVHARLKMDARARGLSLSRFVNSLGVAYMKANPTEQLVVDEGAPRPAPRKRSSRAAQAPKVVAKPKRRAAPTKKKATKRK